MTEPVLELTIIIPGNNTVDHCEINPVLFFPHTSGTAVEARQIGLDTTI
jgi:hypothetical protein